MVEKLFIFEYRQPSFWEYFFSKHFLRVDSTSKQYHSSEKEVYGQLFALEKCFQICYVYEKRKPMYFLFFISSYFEFYQGIHKIKLKHPQNEKRKKLHGFSFYINIANFEAFFQSKKLSANLLFMQYSTKNRGWCTLVLQTQELREKQRQEYIYFVYLRSFLEKSTSLLYLY